MGDDNFTLSMFYRQWKAYQERIQEAVAPLTAEQLALRAAPGLNSIGENTAHIVGCRVGWFIRTLGEEAGPGVKAWDVEGEADRSATDLVRGLGATWDLMADCLVRWSPADMEQTFPDDWDGKIVHLSRAWIVWHVLEHDLHHGGEVSLTMGMHGIRSDFPS